MKPTQEQIDAAEKKAYVDPDVVRAAMSRVPPSWNRIMSDVSGGAFIRSSLDQRSIQVIYTVQRYDDGRIWVHVSACGRSGSSNFFLPSWDEMKRVKNDFIGEDKWAYQVFPSAKDYINQHPCVLHLFALMDGAPALPDFTWGLGTL